VLLDSTDIKIYPEYHKNILHKYCNNYYKKLIKQNFTMLPSQPSDYPNPYLIWRYSTFVIGN